MADPVSIGLLIAVLLIVAMVVVLLFSRTSLRRRPPEGAMAALHRLLLGQREQARRILMETIRSPGAAVEAYLWLGEILRDDGEAARALALHRGILARPQLGAEMRRLVELAIADDLLRLGRPEEAEEGLARLDEHFLDAALLRRRALALHRMGRLEDAADTLCRRAGLGGRDAVLDAAHYLAEIARSALREGRLDTARQRARRALKLDQDCAVAHAVLGDLEAQEGRDEAALKAWRRGLHSGRGAGAILLPRIVDLSHRIGRMESLLAELEEMRAAQPEDLALWRAVADLRLRRGDLEAFFALVEDAPELDSLVPGAWLGWIRHLSARNEGSGLKRLLRVLPDAFGPRHWRCARCGAEDGEPRMVCVSCGSLRPLIATSNVLQESPDAAGQVLLGTTTGARVPREESPTALLGPGKGS